MLKKTFHKLLFITPLLGLILSFTHGINSFSIEPNNKNTVVSVGKNSLKALTLFHEIEESTDYLDFFYEESELEDDFELDWFNYNTGSETFTSTVTENQKLDNQTSFCLQQKSTPLYDLFCNWKYHLS